MQGVYLTAAELVRRGFIVSPTSRSAFGADLLVTDRRCQKAWSIQVKTNGRDATFWLVGHHAKATTSKSHIYVFVNLRKNKPPRYFVVPSTTVAKHVRGHKWLRFYRSERYEDKWNFFGNPEGAATR
jgi:hypothetical protein